MIQLVSCQVLLAPAVLHPRIRNAQIHSHGTSQSATDKLMAGSRESLFATSHMILLHILNQDG